MTYKFSTHWGEGYTDLEVSEMEGKCAISITSHPHKHDSTFEYFELDQKQLYKLIGALHEVQKDLKRGGGNGEG